MSRPRWSTCSRAFSGYLPVTTTTRPRCARTAASASWAPAQRRHRGDGVVGVERPEAVAGRGDGVLGQVPAAGARAGAQAAVISATGKSTPSSPPSARRVAAKPGTVSISVMSRSNPTTSEGSGTTADMRTSVGTGWRADQSPVTLGDSCATMDAGRYGEPAERSGDGSGSGHGDEGRRVTPEAANGVRRGARRALLAAPSPAPSGPARCRPSASADPGGRAPGRADARGHPVRGTDRPLPRHPRRPRYRRPHRTDAGGRRRAANAPAAGRGALLGRGPGAGLPLATALNGFAVRLTAAQAARSRPTRTSRWSSPRGSAGWRLPPGRCPPSASRVPGTSAAAPAP